MNNTIKAILAIIVTAVVVSLVALGLYHPTSTGQLGSQIQNDRFIFTGGITASSPVYGIDNYIANFIQEGGVDAVSVGAAASTKTLTAAEVCNSTFINVTPLGATTTVTFPTSALLLADCLPNIGDTRMISYMSTATSTVVAAGSGGTLGYTSSATVAAGKYAYLRLIRDTATSYKLWVVNVAN